MDAMTIVLRILHIGAGVFWAGAAWFFFLYIEPTAKALGPDAGRFMHHMIAVRRLVSVFLAASTITVLAGAVLFWRVSNGFDPAWLSSGMGWGLTVGAVAAVIAWLIGILVVSRKVTELDQLGTAVAAAGRPPTAEEGARLHRLQATLHTAGLADAILITIAVVGMATARYLTL